MPLTVASFISNIALIGCLTLYPLQRSLCCSIHKVFVYKGSGYKNMLLLIDNFKKISTAHCSVPMVKHPSDEAAPSH